MRSLIQAITVGLLAPLALLPAADPPPTSTAGGGAGVGQAIKRRSNPIISHMFTADPSAHVWADGRLYLYPSHDVAPPRGCDLMDGYHVFSTDDLITWVDHGEILNSKDVPWGRKEGGFMWAPDCAYRNGVYYYYFPHPSETAWNHSWKIGVATSTKPASGFVVKGYIPNAGPYIDPAVFTDDDGQVYFYQGGGGTALGGRLKDNMMEIDGDLQKMQGLNDFHEGAWVFKRHGIYYFMYPDNNSSGTPPNNRMQYAMSRSPLGPWESKGVFVDATDESTMHGSMVEFKGQWYLFYHNGALSGGIGALRSVCMDPVYFNADGTMQKVKQTLGVEWPTFHADINFNRMAGALAPGEYRTRDLKACGIADKSIASIEIPDGYEVELFAQDDFQGRSWRFDSSQLDLGLSRCDHVMSSVKIRPLKASGNLVRNHSFENGSPGFVRHWGVSSPLMSRSSELAMDGAYALKCTGKGGATVPQRIAIKPHTNYQVGVWIRVEPGLKGAAIFDTEDRFDDTCQFMITAGDPAGQWIHKTGSFNSGTYSDVCLRCFTSGDFAGTCYWDGVTLTAEAPQSSK